MALTGQNAYILVNSVSLFATRWQLSVISQEEDVTISGTSPLGYVPCKEFAVSLPRGELTFDAFWDPDQNPFYGQPRLIVGNNVSVSVAYQNNGKANTTAIPNDINGWSAVVVLTRVEETIAVRDMVRYSVSGLIQRGYLNLAQAQFNDTQGGEQIRRTFDSSTGFPN